MDPSEPGSLLREDGRSMLPKSDDDDPVYEEVAGAEVQPRPEEQTSCLTPVSGLSFLIHASFCRDCRKLWPAEYERALVSAIQIYRRSKTDGDQPRRRGTCSLQPTDGVDFLAHVDVCDECRRRWPDSKIFEVAFAQQKLLLDVIERLFEKNFGGQR